MSDILKSLTEYKYYFIADIWFEDGSKGLSVATSPETAAGSPLFHSEYEGSDDAVTYDEAFVECQKYIDDMRRCRVCGCTELNCKQCIEKTGEPCHWVEQDLCSACKEEPHIKVTDSRASSGAVDSPVIATNFFSQLASMGHVVDLTIRIMEKNGKLIVGYIPSNFSVAGLKPLNISGTPEELDAGFFTAVVPAVAEISGLITNVESVKQQAKAKSADESKDDGDEDDETEEETKKPAKAPAKKSPPPKQPAPKKGAKKQPAKKTAPKKPVDKPEKKKPEKPEPKLELPRESSLFDEIETETDQTNS